MLNEQQLNRLMDNLKVSEEGRAIVQKIRTADPFRNVEGRAGNVACRYASKKMGVTIQAESHQNELAAIYLWEHDANTFEFYDQPPQVKMTYQREDGRRAAHRTVPDFFIIQEDFIGWVECKTEEWLIQKEKEKSPLFCRTKEMKWECPPGKAYAAQFGLGFQLRSSSENQSTHIRNLKFLSDYWNQEIPKELASGLAALLARLREEKTMKQAEILRDPDLGGADVLHYAIVHDLVYVDVFQQLLSEPHFTDVYASKEVASILRQAAYEVRASTSTAPKELKLEAGGCLYWGNALFSIKTVVGNQIFIQAGEDDLLCMKWDQIQRLAKKGEIRGTEAVASESDVISRLYKAAGLNDLIVAKRRLDILEAENVSCGQGCPVSARTIRHWKQRRREAMKACNDAILGLIPRISARGNRKRKLDARVIEIMREVITEQYANADAKTLTACWGAARNKCEEENLIPPSEKTFRAEVKATLSRYESDLARGGERAAYAQEPMQFVLDQSSSQHGERPFEIAHIDHTQLDLQLVGSKYDEVLGKPWLSIMLDANTRKVLAYVLTFDPPSYRSCMLLIRDCLRRHSRVPSNIVVDRGSEFQSTYFDVLLARFDITKKSRPPQKARFGSVIERFFGVGNTQFVHNLRGNNKPLQKPRQMTRTHDPRRRAVWTLSELFPAFEEYVFNVYGEMEHPALGVTPNKAFDIGMALTGNRAMRIIPMTADIEMMCLPSTKTGKATIDSRRGIKIAHLYYRHRLMRNPALDNTKVDVRYDPFNLSIAYAHIDGEWVACESEYSPLLAGRTEREILIIASELHGRYRREYERRGDKAGKIARYLALTEQTQAVLLQRKKDAEKAQKPLSDPKSEAELQHASSWEREQHDAWSSIQTETTEDYQ